MPPYVLVVESDPGLQRKVADLLRGSPYEIAAETEVSWARRSIAVRAPDVVVVDTSLSDGPAFSLADDLRRDPETRETPIVFVATRKHRGASHRSEIMRRYAPARYLVAPLELSELRHCLDVVVDATGVDAIGSDDAAPAADPPEATPVNAPSRSFAADPQQRRERRAVERSARSMLSDSVSAEAEVRGNLKRTPFAGVLRRLFSRRATGSLLLMRGSTKKIVAFVDGYPVSVRSNVLGECLGQILVHQRLISPEALSESLRRMKVERRHQGEILVEMGVLSPYNLSRSLIEQVEAKLFEIFSWPDGQYMFKEGDATPDAPMRLERSPAGLIFEGILRHYDEERQRAVLVPYLGKYVSLNRDPMLRLQEMTADPTEQAFIRDIDGRLRLESVIDSARIPAEKARLLLVALAQAGIIEPSDAPVRQSSSQLNALPAHVAEASSGPAAVPETTAPLGSAQLALVAQTVRAQNHFWALGVRAEDSTEHIDVAYDALARSFHPDRYRQRSDNDRKLAQEIFERVSEAHRVLRDPARRRAYAAKVERGGRQSDLAPLVQGAGASPIPVGAAKELYETGIQHLRANHHREAVEVLRQAARMVPDHADFRAALGWALFREAPADARASRAALAELRRAIQLDPKSRRAHYYLGHFYAQSGQADLAIAEFEKLLELDPGNVEVADELRRLHEPR